MQGHGFYPGWAFQDSYILMWHDQKIKTHFLLSWSVCSFTTYESHLTELSVARAKCLWWGCSLKESEVRCGQATSGSGGYIADLHELSWGACEINKGCWHGTEQRRMSLLSAVLSSGFSEITEKIGADSRLAIFVYADLASHSVLNGHTLLPLSHPPDSQHYYLY